MFGGVWCLMKGGFLDISFLNVFLFGYQYFKYIFFWCFGGVYFIRNQIWKDGGVCVKGIFFFYSVGVGWLWKVRKERKSGRWILVFVLGCFLISVKIEYI